MPANIFAIPAMSLMPPMISHFFVCAPFADDAPPPLSLPRH